MILSRRAQIALALAVLLWCVLLLAQWSAGPRDGVVSEYGRQMPLILGIGPVLGDHALARGESAGIRLAILLALAPAALVGAALLKGTGRRFATAVIAVMAIVSFLELPRLSNDIFLYRAAGQMLAEGQNPYLVTPSAYYRAEELDGVPWGSQTSPYGPLALHFFALASVMGGSWIGGFWLLRAFMALPWLLILILLSRSDGDRAPPLLFLAASPLLLLEIVQGGHVDGWIGYLLVVVCALARRERMTPIGRTILVLSLAAAISLKLSTVVVTGAVFVHLARRPRWGWRGASLGLAATLALVVLIWLPLWAGPQSLDGLREESGKVLQSLFQIFRVPDDAASAIATAGSVFALVFGMYLAARGWSLALACMVALVLQAVIGRTFLQPWYFVPVIMLGGWALLEQQPGSRFARSLADPLVLGVASVGLLFGGYGLVFATRSVADPIQTANVALMILPGLAAWFIVARRLS
jgi:hypothetical protein